MNKAHLDHNTRLKLGHNFYRVNNDFYGNPRYVIHWLAFGSDYDESSNSSLESSTISAATALLSSTLLPPAFSS